MKTVAKIAVLLFFVFLQKPVFAQDLIVKKDGSRINCKILRVDSTSFIYSRGRERQKFYLDRSEVENYYIAGSEKKQDKNGIGLSKKEIFNFGLRVGFSNPIKEFASLDVTDESAGLSQGGFLFQGYALAKVAPNFAIAVLYRNQQNKLANDVINNFYTVAYPGVRFTTLSSNWKVQGFFGGLQFRFPLTKTNSIFISASAFAGLPRVTSPKIIVVGTQSGSSASLTQDAGMNQMLGLIGELSVNFKVGEKYRLEFGLNYLDGTAGIDNVLVTYPNGKTTKVSFEQKIKTVNLEFGLVYFFLK